MNWKRNRGSKNEDKENAKDHQNHSFQPDYFIHAGGIS